MSHYLTELARIGRGQRVNSDPVEAVKYKDDIFRIASERKMDICVLCGSMSSALREGFYKKVAHRTFADAISAVLQANRNVLLLLWAEDVNNAIAPSIVKLIKNVPNHEDWGKLDVRISGTTFGSDKLNHFAVARNRTGDDWAVRVEKPHGQFADAEWGNGAKVPAAILLSTGDAAARGRELLEMFDRLFSAVPDKPAIAGEV